MEKRLSGDTGDIRDNIIYVFGGFLFVKLSAERTWSVLEMRNQSYHNGITGPSGEVYVVRVGGYPAISALYVARHILTDVLDALTGTVGPWNTWRRTLV